MHAFEQPMLQRGYTFVIQSVNLPVLKYCCNIGERFEPATLDLLRGVLPPTSKAGNTSFLILHHANLLKYNGSISFFMPTVFVYHFLSLTSS